MLPSRIEQVQFRGRSLYVKRDDLIDPCLSGNKYRKLYSLVQTPSNTYTTIISYGGAQSNAMYSLACLCRDKGWAFHYYTKTLPDYLKCTVNGNLALALEKGMKLHAVNHEDFEAKIEELKKIDEKQTLVISQGGADEIAKAGVSILAREINKWKAEQKLEKLCVVLPSGTGTTALYLQAELDEDATVYTSVLVGDETYQYEQWKRLSQGPYPKILHCDKKRKFAKPYDDYLQMHKEIEAETGIVFDLIYAPKTWMEMMELFCELSEPLLYIHTGGLSGNETMLERYRFKQSRKR